MAKYQASDLVKYAFGGLPGHIECLCGIPAMLCNGNHPNCSRANPNQVAKVGNGWPTCKFCGWLIHSVQRNPVRNPLPGNAGGTHIWSECQCDPTCKGYPPTGAAIAQPAVPAAAPQAPALPPIKTVSGETEAQVSRRLCLMERLRQAQSSFRALGHVGGSEGAGAESVGTGPSFPVDWWETEWQNAEAYARTMILGNVDHSITCGMCGEAIKVSPAQYTSRPIRGGAASVLCPKKNKLQT